MVCLVPLKERSVSALIAGTGEEVVRHLANMREFVLVTPPLVDLILWDKGGLSSGEIFELIAHLIGIRHFEA
jgi:hypothetical protein